MHGIGAAGEEINWRQMASIQQLGVKKHGQAEKGVERKSRDAGQAMVLSSA